MAVATILVLYAGMTVDIFANAPHHTPAAETLEFDELLGAIVVLFLGLVWATRRMLRERREMAQRGAVEREMRILAFHDPLTDLPNRRQFNDALKAAVAALPRAGASHAVLLLDLNGFKRINDVFGHPIGDEVLIHVAARISKAVRDGDMAARLGGDEFAVLATHLPDPETATGLALRIIEGLRSPITASSTDHSVGIAIGIALAPRMALAQPNSSGKQISPCTVQKISEPRLCASLNLQWMRGSVSVICWNESYAKPLSAMISSASINP
ncbi:MAG: GGDEF domain-containing protein [Ignavibacteriota bacterium]